MSRDHADIDDEAHPDRRSGRDPLQAGAPVTPPTRPRDAEQGGDPPCSADRSDMIDDDYLYWPLD